MHRRRRQPRLVDFQMDRLARAHPAGGVAAHLHPGVHIQSAADQRFVAEGFNVADLALDVAVGSGGDFEIFLPQAAGDCPFRMRRWCSGSGPGAGPLPQKALEPLHLVANPSRQHRQQVQSAGCRNWARNRFRRRTCRACHRRAELVGARPALSTAMRWPIVIASNLVVGDVRGWVVPSWRCRSRSGPGLAVRSLAGRGC